MKREFFFIFLIFFFAFSLRIFNLSNIPNGFHMDEVANAYIGRFILENGKDIYGNSWPLLYFNKFGDFPPVLPMYFSGLSTLLFGVNIFAARVPSALIGSLIVFPLYFLIREVLSKKGALIAILLISVLPWHLSLSRASSEGIFGFTAVVTGLALIFYGIYKRKNKFIFLSFFFFLLSYFLYPSFRLLVPLILFPLIFMFRENKKTRLILIISLILFFLLTFYIGSTTWGRGRFSQTSILTSKDDAAIISNNLQRLTNDEGNNSAFVARVFHNKVISYSQAVSELYLSYFSPVFLFTRGGMPERYKTPAVGLVYFSFLIFIASIFFFKIKSDKKINLYFIYLLLIAALPGGLTIEDATNVHRSIFMILPIIFFVSLGVLNLMEIFKKNKLSSKLLILFIVFFFLTEILYGFHQYFSHAGRINSFYRTDGNYRLAEYLSKNKNKYEKVILTYSNWIQIYYLYKTSDFSKFYIGRFGSDFKIKNIENLVFLDEPCLSVKVFEKLNLSFSKNDLFINDGNCPNDELSNRVLEIPRVDSTIAFKLFKPVKKN